MRCQDGRSRGCLRIDARSGEVIASWSDDARGGGGGVLILRPCLRARAKVQRKVVAHEHVQQAELAARERVAHVAHDALKRRADADLVVRLEECVAVVDGQLDEDKVRAAGNHPISDHEGEYLGSAVAAECGHFLDAHAPALCRRLKPLGDARAVARALLRHAAAEVAHAQRLASLLKW